MIQLHLLQQLLLSICKISMVDNVQAKGWEIHSNNKRCINNKRILNTIQFKHNPLYTTMHIFKFHPLHNNTKSICNVTLNNIIDSCACGTDFNNGFYHESGSNQLQTHRLHSENPEPHTELQASTSSLGQLLVTNIETYNRLFHNNNKLWYMNECMHHHNNPKTQTVSHQPHNFLYNINMIVSYWNHASQPTCH